MPEMVSIPEIAKRLQVDGGTVRRHLAKEKDDLKIELHRGKGDKLLLTREDADHLIAAYESRRGPIASDEDSSKYDRFGSFYIIQLVPEALPNLHSPSAQGAGEC